MSMTFPSLRAAKIHSRPRELACVFYRIIADTAHCEQSLDIASRLIVTRDGVRDGEAAERVMNCVLRHA